MKEPAHRARHPFGQIPTYEEGALVLFESGAIVFHIAEGRPGLLPDDPHARARAITWICAALNTVEPPILELQTARFMERDKSWYEQRLPIVEHRIRNRLAELSDRLGTADWLDGEFSARSFDRYRHGAPSAMLPRDTFMESVREWLWSIAMD